MGTVETMFPNSAVSNTGNGNAMMATTGSDISMMPVLASNTVVPNPAGMGCIFPGGSGFDRMHSNTFMTDYVSSHKMFHDPVLDNNVFSNSGDYFSSISEPLGTMLQCQQGIGCMSMGTTNRIMPTLGVQGIKCQTFPTPGMSGSQFVLIKTTPWQFTGGKNGHCCNMSGKTSGGMDVINLQRRNSSYDFINNGIQQAGNSQHFMNGTIPLSNSGGSINASEYSKLQAFSHQNVTQQHQHHLIQSAKVNQWIQLAGDGYATNTVDLMGSGNFYGPASSDALLTTTSLDAEYLGFLSRKLIPVPESSTQQHQQNQHSKKGLQLSVGRGGELQNQPELTVYGRNRGDTETHQDRVSKKELPEQNQLPRERQFIVNDPCLQQTEAWNDYSLYTKQVNPEQSEKLHKLQVLSSQEQQKTQTNNIHGNLSAEGKPEVSLHGDWQLQSQEKLQLPQQFSSFIEQPQPPQQEPPQVDQYIMQKHQMSQQILGNDIALITMSQAGCGTAGNTAGNAHPCISASKQKMQYVARQKLLLYFYHASKCSAPECEHRTGAYITRHKLWAHVTVCHDRQCIYPYCRASWTLIRHHQRCSDKCCPVCGPVRQLLMKHLANKHSQSSSHGAAEFVNGVPNSSNFNRCIGTTINFLENYRASVLDTTQEEPPPTKRRKIEFSSPSCSQQEVKSTLVSARIPSEMQGLNQMQTQPSGHESGMLKSEALNSILVTSTHDRTHDKLYPIKSRKFGPSSSSCSQQDVESTLVPMRSSSEIQMLTQMQTQRFQPSGHDSSMMKSDISKSIRVEPALVTLEQSVRSQQGHCQNKCLLNKDNFRSLHAEHDQIQEKINKTELALSFSANVPMQIEQEPIQVKQESIMNVLPYDSSASGNFGKPMNPKVKGASLTDLFTLEQIREHIIGLQKWAGKSKGKAETHQSMECEMSDEACQLCKLDKLTFDPPSIYCSICSARIKPNATWYHLAPDDTRHCICVPCYNKIRCDTVEIEGNAYAKSKLVKEKNEEVGTEEAWVFCDNCKKWQHNICALFNGKKNEVEQAEYLCPHCYTEQIKRGVRKPLPPSSIPGAKDLPTTYLSDHIEQRLSRRLEEERNERATALGKSFNEVPGADALVVRVVSSVDKILEVKQQFLENFQHEDFPTEFPYKSKVLLLFQKIDGVEVCLFGMYVQEYGSECSHPNQRRIYLSYLDSVKYFRPDVKTVTGEALRTFVFHEILIGYLEYSKRRGFASCYIWVCPPLNGDDYILYRHPEIQKTPNPKKLREWYLMMLRKASKEDIVLDITNLYELFFVCTGEQKAKITAARLPYFDGDFWPVTSEKVIMQLQQEEQIEQKQQKTTNYTMRTSSKTSAQVEFASNSSKGSLVMKKYRETVRWSKENFIMVHLQHACTHCCLFIVSGNRWVCKQCKNFQICDKCYELEQNLEQKKKHPIKSSEKHTLSPIEVTDVPADTKDKDDIMECEFFDTRHTFLSLCQENNYQYDALRRAKHSSMMVLYHLHNRTAPAHRFVADQDAQIQEARENGVQKLQKIADSVKHASQCVSPNCAYQNCQNLKRLFRHGMNCKTGDAQGCTPCKKMWYVLQLHARACKESECCVHRC
ncbi:hypothetical protein KI387_035576, partial [Taxus chinensis]